MYACVYLYACVCIYIYIYRHPHVCKLLLLISVLRFGFTVDGASGLGFEAWSLGFKAHRASGFWVQASVRLKSARIYQPLKFSLVFWRIPWLY